jgi:hypothetical protein
MAGLVIIDEKGSLLKDVNGYPHAHLILHYDQPTAPKWLGFFGNGELYGKVGIVLEDVREELIDRYVRFEVEKDKLDLIATKLVAKYNKTIYNLGMCDCVSFAADACRVAGISVPQINMTPGGFVWWLTKFKKYQTHVNTRPFPWSSKVNQAPREKSQRLHKVASGDTLASIAKRYYGKASLWTTLYSENQKLIGPNPDRIVIGQQLVIPCSQSHLLPS